MTRADAHAEVRYAIAAVWAWESNGIGMFQLKQHPRGPLPPCSRGRQAALRFRFELVRLRQETNTAYGLRSAVANHADGVRQGRIWRTAAIGYRFATCLLDP